MDLGHTVRNLPALKVRREKVPEHRRKSQTRGTLLGVAAAAVGLVLLVRYPAVSPYLGYVLIAFGGFSISRDQVTAFGKAGPQIIAAFVRAFRGEAPADEVSRSDEHVGEGGSR